VPMCFVRLLKHWYKEQTMQIKWGKHFSEQFHVSNGVRQGGVLSPYLFAVYLDDLSTVAILRGGLGGHAPPRFLLGSPSFFLISRSSSFG